jgi:hypothetical protein
MMTEQASQPVSHGSFNLLWTLAIRSIGVTAGVAVALLLAAALIAR